MNRTIEAPKPGNYWPVMLGHMVPGRDMQLRKGGYVNYVGGPLVSGSGMKGISREGRQILSEKLDLKDKASRLGKLGRMMDMDDPHRKHNPAMFGSMMKALGLKPSSTTVERFPEDLSWRGATQNRPSL